MPVSWEISCYLCHKTAGISAATDILRKHDQLLLCSDGLHSMLSDERMRQALCNAVIAVADTPEEALRRAEDAATRLTVEVAA